MIRREGVRPAVLLVVQTVAAVAAFARLAGMVADWLRGLEHDGEGWHVIALVALSLACGTAYRQHHAEAREQRRHGPTALL